MSLYKLHLHTTPRIFHWICSSCTVSYLFQALHSHTQTHTHTHLVLCFLWFSNTIVIAFPILSPFLVPHRPFFFFLFSSINPSFPPFLLYFPPCLPLSLNPLSLSSPFVPPVPSLSFASLLYLSFQFLPNSFCLLSAILPLWLSVFESDYIWEGSGRPWRPGPRSNPLTHNHKHSLKRTCL